MRKVIYTLLAVMAITLVSCSSDDPNEPRELIRIAGLKAGGKARVSNIRIRALEDAATSVGAQAGLQWRAEHIDCLLKEQNRELDQIYDFHRLLLRDHVLPPVLSEGRQTMNLSSFSAIRTADTVFRIIKPPRFITTAPNWREYLWLNFKKPEDPSVSLLPKSREEAAIWNCYVKKGWDQGQEQADQIFTANLERLNRDYLGMVLYHRLYSQNMVTSPFVSKTEMGVTGDENEMRINDRVLRIAATSHLNTDSKQWRASIWPMHVAKLTPAELAVLPKTLEEMPSLEKLKRKAPVNLPEPDFHKSRYLPAPMKGYRD